MDTAWSGTRIGLYTRLSEDRGSATSVQRQDAEARSYVEALGAVIVGTWSDPDASAYSETVHRPGFDALLEAARAGRIDAVCVWALDRLTRQPAQMEQVISLMRKTGLRLLSVKDGKVDLGAGALIPRFLTWRAEAESMRISQRVKSANRKLAREGKAHPGGMRPFGHERGCHALRQEEAAVIREAAERLIAGESLYAISMDWRARGIKTATGKEWTGANLRKTLSKPRLAGYRERDGELFRGEGGIVRILDDSVWEQVKTILADPARTRPEVRVARHLLTNLVCCGRCGQRMVAGTDRGRRVYICQPSSHPGACGRMSCSAERAEEAIAEIWIAAFDSPDAVDSVSERVRAAAEAQDRLRDLRDRLAALTTAHFVEGVIDRPQYMDAKRELEARIADIEGEERRRERTKRIAALQGNSQAVWERASLSERRALLALVVARIAILPRGKQVARFDPTRMAIEWRA